MSNKERIKEEIRAILRPRPDSEKYFIQHVATGLFYRSEDYDLSICEPLPGAVGKRVDHKGDVFKIGRVNIYF